MLSLQDAAPVGSGVPPQLEALRSLIQSKLKAPPELLSCLTEAVQNAGMAAGKWTGGSPEWQACWSAIKQVRDGCRGVHCASWSASHILCENEYEVPLVNRRCSAVVPRSSCACTCMRLSVHASDRAAVQVWGSKWTERAWLSRRAQGIADADLYMGVVLQSIIPADYAFVLHTADPVLGERGVTHGEMVLGMGEALVSNLPGRALAFRAVNVDGGGASLPPPQLTAMPSKRVGLFVPNGALPLIARSDSNGEDLEAFAGAGLYDSVPLTALEARLLKYAEQPIVWDEEYRSKLLQRLSRLGAHVEAAFGGAPQDIEGVLSDGKLWIVQSRPQVLKQHQTEHEVAA